MHPEYLNWQFFKNQNLHPVAQFHKHKDTAALQVAAISKQKVLNLVDLGSAEAVISKKDVKYDCLENKDLRPKTQKQRPPRKQIPRK